MVKNQQLPAVICTPTTKDDAHDRPISGAEVVGEGWMSAADWEYTQEKALALFAHGQRVAAARNLILVDTKYEFGKDADGVITLIDEIHTPDSSRYWVADTYAGRMAAGGEPEFFDKEFLRVWYRDHCDPYADGPLPTAPPSLVAELSRRYIALYHQLTGGTLADLLPPAGSSLTAALAPHMPPAPGRIVLVRDPEHDAAAAAAFLAALPPSTHRPSVPHGAPWMDVTPVAVELESAGAAPAALPAALAADRLPCPTVVVVLARSRQQPVILVSGAVSPAAPAPAVSLGTAAALAAATPAAPYAVVCDPAAAAAAATTMLRWAVAKA